MILNKLNIALAIAFFAVLSWAEPNASVEDVAFSHASIGVEGGEIYPFGELEDAVESSLYGGLNFRYSYWENVEGVLMFHYAYFKPIPEAVPYDGVHQASGKLGMDVQLPWIRFAKLGAGFACNWTRADLDGEDKNEIYGQLGGTLGDNETEFGWYARMNLNVLHYEKYKVGLNVMWEELWTLPERSDMLYVGLYVERSLW
jgi:hypothetical protein